MKKLFIIYGTLICILFTLSNYHGIPFFDALDSSKWKHQGRQKDQTYARGSQGYTRFYHK